MYQSCTIQDQTQPGGGAKCRIYYYEWILQISEKGGLNSTAGWKSRGYTGEPTY